MDISIIILEVVEEMKINDFIFRFKYRNDEKSLCRVRTFLGRENKIINLITDLEDLNISKVSLINSIEFACSELIEKNMTCEDAIFIEHTESESLEEQKFDMVTFNPRGGPIWKNININEVKKILNCIDDELINTTKKNRNLVETIDRIRYRINPETDFLYKESPEVIKRKLEIKENRISKSKLEDLIKNRSKEQEIARLLKSDLSVFGEVYSFPKDEYICFSEYPIYDRYIDYVVITGRSRMQVYLIEIKGAEFNLVNKDSKFNEKINEADSQISRTLGYIFRNYMAFKDDIHEKRRLVEKGEKIFNSFRGPISKLEVDRQKDITIHSVIIGGVTNDDIKESRLRHDYENKNDFRIKLESWDTFIRKLSNR
ncbi:DUF4263 domain-containing protein [Clostridioides difficile]|uniref:Shedu anti-phage system protein SduA domain-containing protein n=2 Tax=Clostridioides difficile TaxID=1496 RepID=UPI00098AC05C|nr:Shedu anti-phage system protein SduA domain-containing protein [Clostridioides difficile]EGT4545252.1 DUF4263 domain-containing protein [Clostridioides difficile]EGT4612706.1 DUF4263 domain-containing protein [Clostridioides difficile]EGT4731708.1 DUF4263 domain-containing protein [Clostridioides difficile]EGT4779805.1 DUF4263 domain-containing protein [Clostridioides difficile]EGT5365204.1 DUF4263 domain-containing protein [Clostridioides difficile]